jgi:hypothetical protein
MVGKSIARTYIAGQRKMISKCLCCFPFRSTPNSYCCSIIKIHHNLQTEGGGQDGKMHFFFLIFSRGGGAAGGSGRAVGFADIPVRL